MTLKKFLKLNIKIIILFSLGFFSLASFAKSNDFQSSPTQPIAPEIKPVEIWLGTPQDAQAFADKLKTNKTLKSLNLVCMTDPPREAAQAIPAALKVNTTLTIKS